MVTCARNEKGIGYEKYRSHFKYHRITKIGLDYEMGLENQSFVSYD